MGVNVQVIANKKDDHSSLVDFFNGNGYKVSFSTSAKKALREIKKEKPEVEKDTLYPFPLLRKRL